MLKLLCLLLWKNYCVVKRALGLFCVCVFCEIAWFVIIHRGVWKQHEIITHAAIPLQLESISERPVHIFYSPSTNFTDTLLKGVSKGVSNGTVQISPYGNFQDMFYAIYNQPMIGYVVGINFTHPENDRPKTLSYEIWEVFNVNKTHHLNERTVRIREELSSCKRIICIQGAIDKSFIDQAAPDKFRFFGTSLAISVSDTCLQNILDDVHFILIQQNAALSLLTFFIVIFVSRERGKGAHKLMIIAGIPSWSNWLSWLITSFIIEIIPCTVMSIILYLIYMNTNVSFILIYLLVTMYCLASKCAYFFVISVIHQQDFARFACFVLWLLSHWPLSYRRKDFKFKLLTSFIPQMAVIWGYVELEESDENTCAGKVREVVNWSLSTAVIFLTVDSIIYIFLTWIIDVFFNGPFGREFPTRQLKKQLTQTPDASNQQTLKSSVIEEPVVIAIKGLIHQYKSYTFSDVLTKLVLIDINMDILKNEVIFILGSDEDGMSTLIHTLIGCVGPTIGSVTVNGMNPRYFWNIGRYVGICLEKPLFFSDLSPKENLMFFSIFRGNSIKRASEEAIMIMQKLNIKNTTYKHSKAMRKRMCIGMALIGAPPILVLDEPTAGLGVEPRKDVWKAIDLISHKRTVIITTKHKDEADYLADKIALLQQGRILAYGTNVWLKRQFGSGYNLSLKRDNVNNAEAISKVVQNFVPEAKIVSTYGMLLTYNIPYDRRNEIGAMINAIEDKETELGVLNIYIDHSSLAEIYQTLSSSSTYSLNIYAFGNISIQDRLCEKQEIVRNQVKALMWKKFLCTYRFVSKWKFLGLSTFFAHVGAFIVFSRAIHSFDKEEFSIEKYNYITGGYLITGNVPQSLVESYRNALTKITEAFKQIFEFSDMSDTPIGVEMLENKGVLEMNALYGPWVGDICWKSVNVATNAALHSVDPQSNIVMEKRLFNIFLIHDLILEALFFSCFGFVVILAYFPLLPMVEIQKKTKQMQYLSGISDAMYWSVCFFMDIFLYLAFSCAVVALIAYVNEYEELYDLVAVLVLFSIFGLCAIPLTYLHVFLLDSYVEVVTCILVQYAICLIIHLGFIDYENALAMKILNYYPFFGLISAVFKIYMQISENICVRIKLKMDCTKSNEPCCSFPCADNNCKTIKSYFAFSSMENPHGVGDALLGFSIGTVFVTILVIMIDFNAVRRHLYKIVERVYFKENHKRLEDPDQSAEKELAHALSFKKYNNTYLLAVDNVTKIYRKGRWSVKYLPAVDSVSMTIKRGEFFALVGCNDAGKTILVNMIIGQEFPSFGRIRLFASSVGYCPQDVQLFSLLTVHENLKFFAQIRGLSANRQFREVESMLKYFELWQHRNKFVFHLTKIQISKLGIAVAMIGDPEFIIMDISGAGLDPVIRQKFWGTVRQIQKPWQSIIATSDILEDKEGIYTRLAAMKNGKLLSAENWEKTQEKTAGLILRIYVNMSPYNKEQNDLLMEAIEKKFENKLELKLQKRNLFLYNVDRTVTVSTLVNGILDLSKNFVEIEDFSIQKPSILYEVFNK